jgi:hypothetical protein
MLDAIKRLCINTQRLDENKIVKATLDNSQIQHDIIKLNTDEQLYEQGVFADGSPTGDYAANTIEGTKYYLGKKEKGQRYDHITFRDSGALHASLRFDNGEKEFALVGNTVKDGVDLEDTYGKPIVGLTNESVGEVRDYVLPIARDKTLQQIQDGNVV